MALVYRLECRAEDSNYSNFSGVRYPGIYLSGVISGEISDRHPLMDDMRTLQREREWDSTGYFGFISLDSLFRWFTLDELCSIVDKDENKSLYLVVYEAVDILYSHRQLFFAGDTAVEVSNQPLSDFVMTELEHY